MSSLFLRFSCVFVATLACLSLPLRAQQTPKEHATAPVAIRFAGQGVPTNGTLGFHLWEVGQGSTLNVSTPGAGTNALTQSPAYYPQMKPNRHYQATLSADPWDYGEVKFSAPAGYSIWINDQPVSTFRVLGNPFLIFKIELRAADSAGYLPAGLARAPEVGGFDWGISAGRYANGLPAGAVQLNADNLSADLLNPTSLTYVDPGSPEVLVTRHSDGALLELRTFQFLLYVRRNTTPGTGYDVEIYSPYAYTEDTGDGPYSYNETPYRTYRLSNPDGGTWAGKLKIERIEDTTESWTIQQTGNNWTVTETNALRTITRVSTSGSPRTETIEVRNNANVLATKVTRTYQNFPWGQEELTSETANPDAVNGPALTTTYTYNTSAGQGGYARLESVTNPDGSWVRYVYDNTFAGFGNLAAVYRPWLDSTGVTASNASASNSQATTFSYSSERGIFNDLSTGSTTALNGVTTGQTTIAYSFPGNAPNGQPLRTETTTTATGNGPALVSTRQTYNPTSASPDYLGRLYTQTAADGSKVSTLRYKGYFFNYGDNNATKLLKWDPPVNNTWGEYTFTGFATQVQDSVPVSSWDGETFSTVYMVPNRSTVGLSVFNAEGRVWYQVSYVFTGASGGVPTLEFTGLEERGYAEGQQTLESHMNGHRETKTMLNARVLYENHNDGSRTYFDRNALGQVNSAQKEGVAATSEYAAQPQIYTHYTYDGAGRVLTEKVSSDGNAAANPATSIATSRVYNPAGQLVSETAESTGGAFTTTYAYTNGGRTVTTTFPGGATKIVNTRVDGSLISVTGTAVVAEYHTTTVNSNGTITRQTSISAANSPRWTRSTTDWIGRVINTEHPAPPNALPITVTKAYTYDAIGRLTKTTEPGLADALVAYNAWGQAYRSGLDLNANGTLDLASTDRISESDSYFEKDGNAAWWAKQTTKTYNVDNSATPITTSTARTRLNKFDDHGRFFGSFVQSESEAIDIFGNVTRQTVAVQRGSSYFATDIRLVTATTDLPDSNIDVVQVSRNGLAQTSQNAQGFVSRSYYDALNRLVKQTDPRTDPSTTPRIGFVANSSRTAWVQDSAGNQTNYTYEPATGRVASVTDPLGKKVYTAYTVRGEAYRSWGDATYPVEYSFNAYGERTGMNTYRGGTGWNAATWPAAPGTADATTWAYDPATGTLTSKTDAQNRVVAYTYTARGQLKTRQWARAVTTTYAYSATTAEQTGIDYSDATPDLSYTYDRLGRNLSTGDVTGTRTFNYNATTGQLTSETLPNYFANRVLSRTYESVAGSVLGRDQSVALSGANGIGAEASATYGYDNSGRLNSVGSGSATFNYSYTGNSNLISTIVDAGSGWTQTRSYLGERDLVDVMETKVGSTSKAKFDYDYDLLGRRVSLAQSGDIFSRYQGGGEVTKWTYNDRSEVVSAKSYHGSNPADLSNPVGNRDFAYSFDNIGNRLTSSVDGRSTSYATNNLNQLSSRNAHGSVDISGLAASAASVTANGQSTVRQGDYYHKSLGVTNSSAAIWQNVNVTAAPGGSINRNAYVGRVGQIYSYDADGNLTTDEHWDYTWDAENRLVAVQTNSMAVAIGAPSQRMEFGYDFLGRRILKRVLAWQSGAWALLTEKKFIYDGWNLIGEYNSSGNTLTLAASYTWGLDITGDLDEAGGVGALLQVTLAGAGTHLAVYDANGNVNGLINRATGSLSAIYEYSSFGETLAAYGAAAAANAIRFSSKYADVETGFIWYGFRYLDPTTGRWLGRDPIEEQGGLNLYSFCGNNGINHWDYLGQSWFSKLFKGIGNAVSNLFRGIGRFFTRVKNEIQRFLGRADREIGRLIMSLEERLNLNINIQVEAGVSVPFGNAGVSVRDTLLFYGFGGEAASKDWSTREPGEMAFYDVAKGDDGKWRIVGKTDHITNENVYTNGILGSLPRHAALGGAHIEYQLGQSVTRFTLVNNPSVNILFDSFETMADKVGVSSVVAKMLANEFEYLKSHGKKVNIIAHSQGASIVASSLEIVRNRGGTDFSNLNIVFHAGANNARNTNALASAVGARIGGYYFSDYDLVPTVIGGNGRPLQMLRSLFGLVYLFTNEDDLNYGNANFSSPHTAPSARWNWTLQINGNVSNADLLWRRY
jgi:RHS repeat-associated protein